MALSLPKISQSDLSKIRCHCGQFLSKPPIYFQNGQNICNECVDLVAPAPLEATRNVIAETLARNFTFPCRYQPQGCSIYVNFDAVAAHEAECSNRVYGCPANSYMFCDWNGTAVKLCEHYASKHPKLCFESTSVRVQVDKESEYYLLVKKNEVSYLLWVKCELRNKKFWSGLMCFLPEKEANLVRYSVTVSVGDEFTRKLENVSPVPMSTKNRNFSQLLSINTLDIPKSPNVTCTWSINVTEEFWIMKAGKLINSVAQESEKEKRKFEKEKQKFEKEKQLFEKEKQKFEKEKQLFEKEKQKFENIKCVTCGIYAVPPIYLCPNKHVICVDCIGYGNECRLCYHNYEESDRAGNLEQLAKQGRFRCKWANCQVICFHDKIRAHERTCPNRIYVCPECTAWSGLYKDIENHLTEVHEHDLYVSTKVSFDGDCDSFYVLAHNELFKVDTFYATVVYYGSPQYADRVTCKLSGSLYRYFKRTCNYFQISKNFEFFDDEKYRIQIQFDSE